MAMLRARGGSSLTTAPSSRISPDGDCSRPALRRIKVVLPQPEGPSRTRNSPSLAMRSIPSTAHTSSKCLEIRRASTVAMKGLGLVRDLRFLAPMGARVDAGPPFFSMQGQADQIRFLSFHLAQIAFILASARLSASSGVSALVAHSANMVLRSHVWYVSEIAAVE